MLSGENDASDWSARQREHSVEFILGLLEQAARGQHAAWALGNAMSSIANRRGGPITAEQASRLKAAAGHAGQGAIRHLSRYLQQSQIAAGMQALAIQIDQWRSDQNTSLVEVKDAQLVARILRNTLHNLDLSLQLAERSVQRQAEREALRSRIISTLLQSASEPLDGNSRGVH